MTGSCLGEFANPSPQRVRSLAEHGSLVDQGSLAAAVSFSCLRRYCLASLDGAQSRRSCTWGKRALDGRSRWMPVGRGSALACRIRRINKLVCRRARCRRLTLCRVRRMRKRRMCFGGKRKIPYSLLAWTCAKPRSCAFSGSALVRRSCPQWRYSL